jgi:hypothetical protein
LVLLFILVFVSIILSIVNIFFLFKFIKSVQESQVKTQNNINEEGNVFLARFQKITSTRLRALDNKIEIVDQLLKDLDDAYAKTYSLLSDLESRLTEQKREEIVKNRQKLNSDNYEIIQKQKHNKKELKRIDSGKRVYELSKEINMDTKDLINFINKETEIQIYNHLQKLSKEEETLIKGKILGEQAIKIEEEMPSSNVEDEQIVDVERINTSKGSGKKEKIIDLHRQGLSPQEIGKELKIGVGEIMLVLSLFNQD